MASRPILAPFQIITNGNMASNITSLVTITQNMSLFSYTINWSGTSPTGTVNVQVSNDYSQDASGTVLNAGSWVTLPMSSSTAVSGNTGTGFIDIGLTGGYAYRLQYAASGGTGVMQAFIVGKVA